MTTTPTPPTAPLLRIRPDGVPEMLVAGTLADGARYEASAEAARAWAAWMNDYCVYDEHAADALGIALACAPRVQVVG